MQKIQGLQRIPFSSFAAFFVIASSLAFSSLLPYSSPPPMDMVALSASARSKDASASQLRKQGFIPGIVYGNIENISVQCEERDLKKAYGKAGESTLVELSFDGKKVPVLFHDLDFDPVSDRPIHVDFYAVDMKKEVEAEVTIRLEGDSPAVKDHGAIIVTPVSHVTVRCLPSNLPHDLPINLSALAEIGAIISVKDLSVPKGVEILDAPETVLAIAQEARAEEVVTPAATPAEGEGVVAAEGAAAPAEGAAAEGAAKAAPAKKE